MQKSKFPSWLSPAQIFGIDLRSLALFRIALALVLIGDLAARALNLGAFYSDQGVLPRSAQIEIYSGLPWLFSLHLLSGLVAVQAVLFAAAFLSALALLFGYRTRWATLISWVLLISLHNRNPMVVQGGDVLLRMLLFWGMFLPLGALFSFDHARHAVAGEPETELEDQDVVQLENTPVRPFPTSVLSLGALAILLQVCFVYWFSAALKNDASWHKEGSALYYALNIDQMVTAPGKALLAYPGLLRFLTSFTVYLEYLGPLLALLPIWRLRLFMVLVFMGFHLMLGLCLTLGIFPIIGMVAWTLFIPSQAWDLAGKWWDRSKFPGRVESIGATWARNAMVKGLIQPIHPQVPTGHAWKKWTLQTVAACFLVYIFFWNLRTIDSTTYGRILPTSLNWIGEATRTDQRWGMFAPYPLKDDGWYVIPAQLANGEEVDLYKAGAPVSWDKPSLISATYPDALWQKYLLNIWPISNAAHRAYYAAYITRQWNQSHDASQRIKSMQIIYMREDTLPEGTAPVKKVVLWRQKS